MWKWYIFLADNVGFGEEEEEKKVGVALSFMKIQSTVAFVLKLERNDEEWGRRGENLCFKSYYLLTLLNVSVYI